MSAQITWTDALGPTSLDNGLQLCRFSQWEPYYDVNGPRPHALADGRAYKWVHSHRYGARFSLEHIPIGLSRRVMRLLAHLEQGGEVTVETGDREGSTYTCMLAPDAPDAMGAWTQQDRTLLLYRLELDLIRADVAAGENGGADPEGSMMLCFYDGDPEAS